MMSTSTKSARLYGTKSFPFEYTLSRTITNAFNPDQSTDEELVSRTPCSTEDADYNEDEEDIDTSTYNSILGETDEETKILIARLRMSASDTTCLWPEKSFILLERDSKRVLALRDGKVCLIDQKSMSNSAYDLSCHWHCFEDSNRWWGLRNAVSGMYLGQLYPEKIPFNKTNMLVASSPQFNESSRLYPRENPDGGYELFLIHKKELVSINMGEDYNSRWDLFVCGKETRVRWEFIEV